MANDDEDPIGEPFECKLLDGGECPLPLLESLTGGVKFCGFRLIKKQMKNEIINKSIEFTCLYIGEKKKRNERKNKQKKRLDAISI